MQVSTFAPNMAVRRRNLGNLFVCCEVCLARHIYQQLNCGLAVCVDAAAAEAPFQAAKHSKKPTRRLQKSGGAFSFTLSVRGRAVEPAAAKLLMPNTVRAVADILNLPMWPAEQLRLVVERQPAAEVRIEPMR